jgi:hypothetical protein
MMTETTTKVRLHQRALNTTCLGMARSCVCPAAIAGRPVTGVPTAIATTALCRARDERLRSR